MTARDQGEGLLPVTGGYGRIPDRMGWDDFPVHDPLAYAILARLYAKRARRKNVATVSAARGGTTTMIIEEDETAFTETALAKHFKVSRKRVRTAIKKLEECGEMGTCNLAKRGQPMRKVKLPLFRQLDIFAEPENGYERATQSVEKGPRKGHARATQGPHTKRLKGETVKDPPSEGTPDGGADAPKAASPVVETPRAFVFRFGKQVLAGAGGKDPGLVLAKLMKVVKDDDAQALDLLKQASQQADPNSWLWAVVHRREKQNGTGHGSRRLNQAELSLCLPNMGWYGDEQIEQLKQKGLWDGAGLVEWARAQAFG